MFRFVIICGCLVAIAQAGLIGGGIITGLPIAAVQPTLTLRPAINTATSSSNIVRGIGPLGPAVWRGRNLIGQQGLSTIFAPSGLSEGWAVNGYGLGGEGLAVNGYGTAGDGSPVIGVL